MSLQEAAPSGPFGAKPPSQAESPTTDSPFQQPLDGPVDHAAMASPAYDDPSAVGSTDQELRSQRRRAWTIGAAAVVLPAVVAGVIAWQLFGGSSQPAPTITRVASTPTAATTEVATPTSAAATTTVAATTAATATPSVTPTSSAAETSTAAAGTTTASTAEAEPAPAPLVDLSSLDPEARLAAWTNIDVIEVLPGETLWLIAQNYDTTISAIATLNGITDPASLSVGQTLRIPLGFADEVTSSTQAAATVESVAAAETVEADPASAAASTVETSTAVASNAAPALTDELANWHTIAVIPIEEGDSLAAIAEANDTTIEALMMLNGIADAGLIYVGDVLLVPVGFQPAVSVVSTVDSVTTVDTMEEESLTAPSEQLLEEESATGDDMLEE